MGFFIGWIILAFIVGGFGSERTCGFAGGFFGSLFLSPVIGLLIVLASSKSSTIEFQKLMLEEKKQRLEREKGAPVAPTSNYTAADYLADLEDLDKRLTAGKIFQAEYEVAKDMLRKRAERG